VVSIVAVISAMALSVVQAEGKQRYIDEVGSAFGNSVSLFLCVYFLHQHQSPQDQHFTVFVVGNIFVVRLLLLRLSHRSGHVSGTAF